VETIALKHAVKYSCSKNCPNDCPISKVPSTMWTMAYIITWEYLLGYYRLSAFRLYPDYVIWCRIDGDMIFTKVGLIGTVF
jgi:hypothetical protein